MQRRNFLGTTAAVLAIGSAGCLGKAQLQPPGDHQAQPPDVDCATIERPEPAAPTADEAIQPLEYPGSPPCPLDGASALEYATAFERAYRRNQEIQRADPYLTEFGMSVANRTAVNGTDIPGRGFLLQLQYVFHGSVAEGAVYDSTPHFVAYYVDPTLVVRAGKTEPGVPEEITWPDPWSSGVPVACFDSFDCTNGA